MNVLIEGDYSVDQLKGNEDMHAYFQRQYNISVMFGGQPNETINELINRLSVSSLQCIDVIILSIGSNDLMMEEPQHITRKLISLIKNLQTACPWMFVVVLPLRPRYVSDTTKPIAVFNAQVSAINASLRTINMTQVICWKHKELLYDAYKYHDCIHLSAAGRDEKFRKSVFHAILFVFNYWFCYGTFFTNCYFRNIINMCSYGNQLAYNIFLDIECFKGYNVHFIISKIKLIVCAD